jgi:hypothetical protein
MAAPGNIRKTVATHGAPEKLSAASKPIKSGVVVPLSTNTGIVVVGDSTVLAAVGSRNSPGLNAGDSLPLGAVDLVSLYVDVTVDGEGVTVYFEQ